MSSMKALVKVSLVLVLILGAGGITWAHMGEPDAPGSGWHSMGFPFNGHALVRERAARIAQAHVLTMGDPGAKVGELVESESHFEAPILAREASCPEKILVDKWTGWLRSVS